MKSNYRGILVSLINIFIAVIYMVLILLLVNYFPVLTNILNNIAVFVKNKKLAIIMVTVILCFPLFIILKFIDKKIK